MIFHVFIEHQLAFTELQLADSHPDFILYDALMNFWSHFALDDGASGKSSPNHDAPSTDGVIMLVCSAMVLWQTSGLQWFYFILFFEFF